MPKTKKFKELLSSVRHTYIGKSVPKKYQKRYGLSYDKNEADSIAYAIAKKHNWRT